MNLSLATSSSLILTHRSKSLVFLSLVSSFNCCTTKVELEQVYIIQSRSSETYPTQFAALTTDTIPPRPEEAVDRHHIPLLPEHTGSLIHSTSLCKSKVITQGPSYTSSFPFWYPLHPHYCTLDIGTWRPITHPCVLPPLCRGNRMRHPPCHPTSPLVFSRLPLRVSICPPFTITFAFPPRDTIILHRTVSAS